MKTSLVIMAAGIGSRFGGGIKQLAPVGPNGEIIMDYSIHDALAAGFDRVVFIIRRDLEKDFREVIGERIEKVCPVAYAFQEKEDLPAGFTCPAERKKPWGTGQAVLSCRDIVNEPFLVINADDYYGKEAFRLMHGLLSQLRDERDAGMVPYVLGNTMSENGGVTRGICRVEQGLLCGVDETHDIRFDEAHRIVGEFGALRGDEMVSMNFWGFHPALLPCMKGYFEDFLRALAPEEIRAECLLPIMVNELLQAGELAVAARASPDRWFGITYQADRESVMEELARLHAEGIYPARLF